MKQENVKYYTFKDVVNTSLQKTSLLQSKKDVPGDVEFSLNVISDLTYSNIWNSFIKWCTDQTELGFVVNIFSFGNMFYVSEKQNEGISVKLTDFFLREHNLKWDETKSTYEGLYRNKYENTKPQIEKLNYIYISTNLNTKKILVQNGLNNLFNSIGYLLESTPNCLLDLGNLGQFLCNNRVVYQVPSKIKGDSVSNKKTTIKSLIDRNNKGLSKEERKNDYYNENEIDYNQKEADELQEKIEKSIDLMKKEEQGKNLIGTQEEGLTEKEKLEIKNAKSLIKELTGGNIKKHKLPKEEQKFHTEDEYYHEQLSVTNKKKLPPLKAKRIVNIPMKEERWNLIDMFHCDFKVVRILKAKANPVLFNVYSNTKAAPFTAEKTQIPIAHRIGSFYSLSLQNFIIDKTNKSIKRLTDDYFFKYRNTKFEELATEEEEYLYIIKRGNINPEKIELKKEAHKRYQNFIMNSINEDYIATMKGDWLVEIIKLINRVYLMKQYDILVNSSFGEMFQDYKKAMKTSILDYILKHPEQKEKLNILLFS